MNRDELTKASKTLSWLLRHGAGESGLAMDAAGWARVDDVLRTLGISRAAFDDAVRLNNKSRLEVEGDRVRASQGHSLAGMPVTREALEASWSRHEGDASVWHGTNEDAVAGIAREGILPGARTHVHLADAMDSKVGKRAAVAVGLEVSPARLRARGVELYRSPNGVILARHVPIDCIVGVLAMTARARESRAALCARLGLPAGPG